MKTEKTTTFDHALQNLDALKAAKKGKPEHTIGFPSFLWGIVAFFAVGLLDLFVLIPLAVYHRFGRGALASATSMSFSSSIAANHNGVHSTGNLLVFMAVGYTVCELALGLFVVIEIAKIRKDWISDVQMILGLVHLFCIIYVYIHLAAPLPACSAIGTSFNCLTGTLSSELFLLFFSMASVVVHILACAVVIFWARDFKEIAVDLHSGDNIVKINPHRLKLMRASLAALAIAILFWIAPTFYLDATYLLPIFFGWALVGLESFYFLVTTTCALSRFGRTSTTTWALAPMMGFGIALAVLFLVSIVLQFHGILFECWADKPEWCFFDHSIMWLFFLIMTIIVFVVHLSVTASVIGLWMKKEE